MMFFSSVFYISAALLGGVSATLCPGTPQRLSCAATSGNVWKGSPLFSCSTSEITLLSSSSNVGDEVSCGIFTARVTSITDVAVGQRIESDLSFNTTVDLDGDTILCTDGTAFPVNMTFTIANITATNLSATQVSPSEAVLSWSIPPEALFCDVRFVVNLSGPSGSQELMSSGSDLNITATVAPGSYSFSVTSSSGSEFRVSEGKAFEIFNSVPPPPANLEVSLDTQSCVLNNITVSWMSPPLDSTTPNISRYVVQYGPLIPGSNMIANAMMVDTTDLTVNITREMLPSINVQYMFSVIAVNSIGQSEASTMTVLVSPSIRSSTVSSISDNNATVTFSLDDNCQLTELTITVQRARCPITGECLCGSNNDLSYSDASNNVVRTSLTLTNLLAGNRYCYRIMVDTIFLHPLNGTAFTTTTDYRPPVMNGASFVSGETYECDGALNAFGGSSKQMSATFDVESGQWILSGTCSVFSWFIAIIVILVILFGIGIAIFGGYGGYRLYKKLKAEKDDQKGYGGDENDDGKAELATYADPNSIEHQQAPGGEEYAMVDRSAKKIPEVSGALYQDPNTIQHEQAPTGDLYAVTEKKPKKKGEVELSQMYSVPDKSKKNQGGLTYAEIDLPGGGGAPPQHQTEYASVVN